MLDQLVRFASIGLRKYSTDPTGRKAASRLMLTSVLRLYMAHSSREDAAKVALEVLTDTAEHRRST